MANKIKSFIKITVTGYVPACDITDRESIDAQFRRIDTITNAANEQMEMVEVKVKPVNKTVTVAEPASAPDVDNSASVKAVTEPNSDDQDTATT